MKRSRSLFMFIAAGLTVCFTNCSPTSTLDTAAAQAARSINYFQKTEKFVTDVFYEPGAEPFVGSMANGNTYWSILSENLEAIFSYRSRPPSIEVPDQLSEMTSLPAQNKTSWTTSDLLALAAAHASSTYPSTEEHFRVFFLNGYYHDGSSPQTGVLGVSLGGTTIIAMFKDVIRDSGANPTGPVPRFVEQSTLVHEIGHALGFVNNGVPMVSPHQDSDHGAHTTNEDCVMYWQNEGKSNLMQFIQRYITSSSKVMWGPEVLADAKALSR